MKILDFPQGSQEWIEARLGLPTASRFGSILTAKTAKLSESSHGYMCELLAERLLGYPVDGMSSAWMMRGSELEESAASWYEFQRGVDARKVGFCLRDDGRVGCSPDRLVGDDGGLEIKCPSAKVHVQHLLGGLTTDHRPQVQGCMWITGARWWDVLSFNPELPPALVRVERDGHYIAALAEAVEGFLVRLDEAQTKLDGLTSQGVAA